MLKRPSLLIVIVKPTWRRKWYKDRFSLVRHVGHEPRVVVGAISKFEIVINTQCAKDCGPRNKALGFGVIISV